MYATLFQCSLLLGRNIYVIGSVHNLGRLMWKIVKFAAIPYPDSWFFNDGELVCF